MIDEDIFGIVREQNPEPENNKKETEAELRSSQELRSDDNFLDELNDRLITEQESGRKACINWREQERLDEICANSNRRLNQYASRGLEELTRLGIGLNIQKALNPQRFGQFLESVGINRSSATLYQRLAKNPDAVKNGIEQKLRMRQVLRNIRQKRSAAKLKAKVQTEQNLDEAGSEGIKQGLTGTEDFALSGEPTISQPPVGANGGGAALRIGNEEAGIGITVPGSETESANTAMPRIKDGSPKKKETVGMYSASVKQWNVQAGCEFACNYCEKSFQASLKRQKRNCTECYNYEPHSHPERLDISLPPTGFLEFIFTCSHGDLAFCEDSFFKKICERVEREPDKNFLFQSKSPKKAFVRPGIKIPRNVILGTTLETNRADLCRKFTNAPPPELRYKQLRDIDHLMKMVTVEPVMDFDLEILLPWIIEINPRLVWLGYDSKKCGLTEPSLEKFKEFQWELAAKGFAIILKKSVPNPIIEGK